MDKFPREPIEVFVVEAAEAEDVPAIKLMVDAAYSKYVERLGKLPAAMVADYGELVATGNVHVLRVGGRMVGSVHLANDGDAITVDSLVVDPSAQGCGYGRTLMGFAEEMARARSLAALTLFTNEKMYENLVFYKRIGFVETGRRTENGFDRVFFRKDLA